MTAFDKAFYACSTVKAIEKLRKYWREDQIVFIYNDQFKQNHINEPWQSLLDDRWSWFSWKLGVGEMVEAVEVVGLVDVVGEVLVVGMGEVAMKEFPTFLPPPTASQIHRC